MPEFSRFKLEVGQLFWDGGSIVQMLRAEVALASIHLLKVAGVCAGASISDTFRSNSAWAPITPIYPLKIWHRYSLPFLPFAVPIPMWEYRRSTILLRSLGLSNIFSWISCTDRSDLMECVILPSQTARAKSWSAWSALWIRCRPALWSSFSWFSWLLSDAIQSHVRDRKPFSAACQPM